jgi:hypothetical protein
MMFTLQIWCKHFILHSREKPESQYLKSCTLPSNFQCLHLLPLPHSTSLPLLTLTSSTMARRARVPQEPRKPRMSQLAPRQPRTSLRMSTAGAAPVLSPLTPPALSPPPSPVQTRSQTVATWTQKVQEVMVAEGTCARPSASSTPRRRAQKKVRVGHYVMRPWPQINPALICTEKQQCCVSEPLPETATHRLAPLEQLTAWVSPWGDLVNQSTKTVSLVDARPPREDWTANYQEWRKTIQ